MLNLVFRLLHRYDNITLENGAIMSANLPQLQGARWFAQQCSQRQAGRHFG